MGVHRRPSGRHAQGVLLLPLALLALWRLRRRLEIALPVLAAWAAVELYRRLRRAPPEPYPAS